MGEKNIWVVGASSGIGYAIARQYAAMGNYVFVTARSREKLAALKADYPSSISVIPGDIRKRESLDRMQAHLQESTDVLDMMILCAGTCEYDDGPTLDVDMYRRIYELNLFAHIECSRIALPLLKKGQGKVVGISSLASVVPFPRAGAYGGSKVAFEYFLSSLKIDLAGTGVDVAIVRPGFVDTPLTQRNDFKMPFICDSEAAAKKIIAGLTRNKSLISFPWQMSWILGLCAQFRGLWQRRIAVNLRKSQEI